MIPKRSGQTTMISGLTTMHEEPLPGQGLARGPAPWGLGLSGPFFCFFLFFFEGLLICFVFVLLTELVMSVGTVQNKMKKQWM